MAKIRKSVSHGKEGPEIENIITKSAGTDMHLSAVKFLSEQEAAHRKAAPAPPVEEQTEKQPGIMHTAEQKKERIHPDAIAFLAAHRAQLYKHDWRPAELYRRNKSKGIAWLGIWNKPGLTVVLSKEYDGGRIIFEWINAQDKKIRQTALPNAIWRKNKNDRTWWPEP